MSRALSFPATIVAALNAVALLTACTNGGLPSHEPSWTSFHASIDLLFFVQQGHKFQFVVHANRSHVAIFHSHPGVRVE